MEMLQLEIEDKGAYKKLMSSYLHDELNERELEE